MTEVKQTGTSAAAREIDKLQEEWFCRSIIGGVAGHKERASTIETIILRRCPDKAGKLVEALEGCIKWMQPVMDGFGLSNKAESRGLLVAARTAISEYESGTKHTERSEDKAVGILVNTLKHNQDCRHKGLGLCDSCKESIKTALAEYEGAQG